MVLQIFILLLSKFLTINGEDEYCTLDDSKNEPSCEKEKVTLFRWDPVKVGHEREIKLVDGKTHKMITKATSPPVFVVDDYLDDKECDYIIEKAKNRRMLSSTLFVDSNKNMKKNYHKTSRNYRIHFKHFDLNKDKKINIPEEIRNFAEKYFAIYLKDNDIEEILQNFEIEISEENKERWINRENFEKFNNNSFYDHLFDLSKFHPRFRDRYSDQVWLNNYNKKDEIIKNIINRMEKVTRLHHKIILRAESIQVLKYSVYGHYHSHFDSQNKTDYPHLPCCHTIDLVKPKSCRLCRYMTVLIYLNDVIKGGETVFPIADESEHKQKTYLKGDGILYNLSKNCYNSTLVITPKKGRMVMWYNHRIDEKGLLGIMDPYAIHGGCDVIEGEKWIANVWIPAADTENLITKIN